MNSSPHNPTKAIWIVDDDQSMRWVLEKTLANNGYLVTTFESAAVALSSFKRCSEEQRPRLIISDVRMPGIDGFELMKQIRNISARIPIIIMTAYSDLDNSQNSSEHGPYEYLSKPFNIDDALELVARACRAGDTGDDQNLDSNRPLHGDWESELKTWAQRKLNGGEIGIYKSAIVQFETTLLECALQKTGGRKQQAAQLLGWGRNTLTRKLQQLGFKDKQ